MSARVVPVGLGEYAVSSDPEAVLVAYGLGSCVAVAFHDPAARVAGLLHAALPLNTNGRIPRPGKFVDSGMMAALADLLKAGAKKERLIVRIAGGSNMLTAPGFTNLLNIGRRNVAAAELVAARESLTIAAADVGGHVGRTVKLYPQSGRMTVRVLGQEEREI